MREFTEQELVRREKAEKREKAQKGKTVEEAQKGKTEKGRCTGCTRKKAFSEKNHSHCGSMYLSGGSDTDRRKFPDRIYV